MISMRSCLDVKKWFLVIPLYTYFSTLEGTLIEEMMIEFKEDNRIVEEDNNKICLYGGNKTYWSWTY